MMVVMFVFGILTSVSDLFRMTAVMVMMVFVYHSSVLFSESKGTPSRVQPGCNIRGECLSFGPLRRIAVRKTALWCIPCTFFLIACALNLIGCIQGTSLSELVKPALLPLLTATTLACLPDRDIRDIRQVGLLVAAQLFGCAGDVLLIKEGFPFFAAGIGAFLIGHVCYLFLFGSKSWKGLTLRQWLIALAVMAVVVAGLVKAIGIHGALLAPMGIYGFVLMLLIFSALAGVIRMPRGHRTTWWILLAGALLFTFSDSCIAMGTFGVMTFPLRHFVVMATYLAAQSLLAVGGVRLILGR